MTDATPQAAPEQPGQAAPATAAPWYDGFQQADLKQWVAAKNIPTAEQAAKSYWELEKMVGADKAGRAIVMPKPDAAPEEVAAFWGKLGTPEKPDGYELQGDIGGLPAAEISAMFHENKIPKSQALGLTKSYQALQEKADQAFAAQAKLDEQRLRAEWGQAFDHQRELGRRALRVAADGAGIPPDDIDGVAATLERAFGVEKAAKMFAALGKPFAEAPMRDGQPSPSSAHYITPADAVARKAMLQQDKEWVARYLNGGRAETAELRSLEAIIAQAR